jgi:CheY-like chemotaxis protein
MPGMGGRECFRALKAINSDVKAVLCTGYGFNVAAQQLLDEGMLGIVAKPYEIEQLSDAIAQALQASSTRPRSTTA